LLLFQLLPPQFFFPKKNSCDIYGKGVTNSSKNSSVNFLHSISTKKIVCFEKKRILMKRLFYSVFVTLLFSLSAFAQNEGISFQGLARNAAGEVLVSQKISLRLSILLDTESGAVAYVETRQVTTNPQGIFSLVVGDDKALTKSTIFSSIKWNSAPKFIKVEMDPNGGTSYVAMGTTRLQAVPFAFYAYGVDAVNVKGLLPVASGGTGVASIADLKTSLGLDTFNSAALDTKVDKVAGKGLSSNDYTTAEKNKLAAVTGTNTGDQDLSSYATTSQLATKANAADVITSLATKANVADVTISLDSKANASDVTTSLAAKANASDVTTSLATKANASDVTTSLATKVDKVTGKELSTNDYTTAEKTKLAAITGTNTGDQVNITGNAGTATKLQTARTINGIAFDGSADITLPTPASGIPYTGATQAVDLGAFDLKVNGLTVGLGNNRVDNNVAIGQSALSSTTTGFQGNYLTAVGFEALKNDTWGYFNTGIGSSALFSNTTGLANTAVGSNSLLSNSTASYNTAVGTSALRDNTTGTDNTAVGSGALEFNTTGELNSAFGRGALYKNTTGGANVASGLNSLHENTTGGANVASGFNAMRFNTTGGNNIGQGNSALNGNTTGSFNTAIGVWSGATNLSGDKNTAIGGYADFAANNLTNATALGYGAVVSASNTIQLGADGTNGNAAVTLVKTSGTVNANGATLTSDLRLKSNISPLANSLATVMQLNPVHYMKKGSLASTAYTREENGFIAQEIQKILPFIVTEGTDENKLLSVDYNSFIPMLTKAIQEQQKQIEDQNAKIAAQQKQIEELIKLVKGQ
jgi:hypothetical protein